MGNLAAAADDRTQASSRFRLPLIHSPVSYIRTDEHEKATGFRI